MILERSEREEVDEYALFNSLGICRKNIIVLVNLKLRIIIRLVG